MSYADLHIHTVYSDGTCSPREIADLALENDISLLAVADHEEIEGSKRIAPICKECGIGYIPACELSAMQDGVYLHILGYGVSFSDAAFLQTVSYNRRTLDKMSDDLIALLSKEDSRVSVSEYGEYQRDARRGGWKGIDYLYSKGVVPYPMAGAKLYGQYGVTYERAGFLSVREIADAIHHAGGRAIIAHAALAKTDDCFSMVEGLLRDTLDGAECYYPAFASETTQRLLSICSRMEKDITCGSDYHGSLTSARIGQTQTDVELVRIGGKRYAL